MAPTHRLLESIRSRNDASFDLSSPFSTHLEECFKRAAGNIEKLSSKCRAILTSRWVARTRVAVADRQSATGKAQVIRMAGARLDQVLRLGAKFVPRI